MKKSVLIAVAMTLGVVTPVQWNPFDLSDLIEMRPDLISGALPVFINASR